ncbi:hypothetical protein C2I18_26835 [Paenibacillus sp. PK3_47]|uniref:hypothetical protein n=1 Tax=Paenibacillus sp. PK3_47 TaxID=2072642 RepID=UPI00201D402F|nr:hypothetical protein [Paenibacillus sp. PK3_47]UQZ36827.1 hypothetical protein C2I18_26835 [Paenibacillus sp. PK3_47]
MRTAYGTFRLIYEDAYWFLGKLLLLYITLPLTAVWIILGLSFDMEDAISVIGGPAYFFFIPFYGIMGFKSLLPIAVGLGSTRTQVLKSFYGVGIAGVAVYMLFLNLCQWLVSALYERGVITVSVSHPGTLYSAEYQFLPYLWIDIMVGLLLFGGAFFIYCIFYRAGMTRTLAGIMLTVIAVMFLYYSGLLAGPIDALSELKISALAAFTLGGAAGLAALFLTYPMMRNASLQQAEKRG